MPQLPKKVGLTLLIVLAHAQEEVLILRRAARARGRTEVEYREHLRGRVVDSRTGEPLAGALVRLGARGAYTDSRGFFDLIYERSGDTLYVSFLEYRTKRIVITRLGEVVVALEPMDVELGAVEIVEEADRATEAAVAVERLRSLEFGEAYTAERIMRQTTDFYVPNVLRRLPGISLLTGRWVSVRGLAERYNAFAFGMAYPGWLRYDGSMSINQALVSTLLGRVEIRKVWTPELLGHFGGGMIDFQLPEGGESGLTIAVTGEMGSWGLGRRYPVVRGSWAQWENRDLPDPALIQASAPGDRPTAENFVYARQYRRLVAPDTGAFAPPGPLVSISYNGQKGRWQGALRAVYGQRWNRERIVLSDGTFDSSDGRWRYEEYLNSAIEPVWHLSRNAGLSGTLSYRLSERQGLSLSVLGVGQWSERHSLDQGSYYNSYLGDYLTYWYPTILLERSQLGMGRLRWSHQGESWSGGVEVGVIGQRYGVPFSGAMNYGMYPGDSVLSYDRELWGSLEVYALTWHSRSGGLQGYGHPYVERRWGSREHWIKVRIGGWYSWEGQRNEARLVGLMPDTTQASILTPEVLLIDGIREVYAEGNRVPGGFWLVDRTGDYYRWRAQTIIGAGYGMVRAGWGRWEGMIGARYEGYERRFWHWPIGGEGYDPFFTERRGDLLSSAIVKYRTGEVHHIRGAAYRTLIRPPATMQVPMQYFDYLWGFYWGGDTAYKTGSAWNADVRWEWVKGPHRLIAVGLFYKALQALPEVYLEPSSYTEVSVFKTRNRSYGEVGGIEVEVREVLWGDVTSPRLWGYVNATISESGSRFWRGLTDPYNERLQGQAPYVVNAGLIGRPTEKWEVGSYFNYTGPQIWAMGFDRNIYPNLVERGRAFWEVQVSRRLGRWEVRVSVWDILNQPYRRVQRVGNAFRPFDPMRDAQPVWQRDEWRFYLTVRYRVF
jgi:hypothetical protein